MHRHRKPPLWTCLISLLLPEKSVKHCGSTNNGCTVLIIVEDRNFILSRNFFLNIETFRRFDIFKINTAESRFKAAIMSINLSGSVSLTSISNTSMPANFLKSTPFLPLPVCLPTPQYCPIPNGCSVGDHGNQITSCGIFIGICRIFLNF